MKSTPRVDLGVCIAEQFLRWLSNLYDRTMHKKKCHTCTSCLKEWKTDYTENSSYHSAFWADPTVDKDPAALRMFSNFSLKNRCLTDWSNCNLNFCSWKEENAPLTSRVLKEVMCPNLCTAPGTGVSARSLRRRSLSRGLDSGNRLAHKSSVSNRGDGGENLLGNPLQLNPFQF